ncbi:hypothetical protein AGOR_G00136540 [Albula goreensis]|uniref:Uncharacterized protein n=1 Tax=Albula goreensis TaxID=1534307 RepID=A0A8T3D540_9TELE|nr:hypothetical protein AGOR_G00136540 [Albula goreensis]
MSDLVILALIVVITFLSVLLTIFGYVLYSGLFSDINIRTGSPPIKNVTVAYKYKQGPYKECGTLFTESCSIGPKLSSIGVFYDDPKKVPGDKCRCAIGSILSEGDVQPCEDLLQLYQKFGFHIFSFPEVTHVVAASFPHRTPLSVFLGVQRVYAQLGRYIKERKLCAHPFIEIYQGNLIHYMSPLARQSDFYVPELQEAEWRQDFQDSEEDRRMDITDADSDSETSSVSHMMSDSRESSLASSVVPSLIGQGSGHRDQWCDSRSNRSSSSFEELDLELPNGQEVAGCTKAEASCNELWETTPEEREAVVEGEE